MSKEVILMKEKIETKSFIPQIMNNKICTICKKKLRNDLRHIDNTTHYKCAMHEKRKKKSIIVEYNRRQNRRMFI
jgi:hypothetical protein